MPCMQIGGYKISPLLHWSDAEVWEIIKSNGAEYCVLYDEGFKRIGCMACPLAHYNRLDDLKRWPWAYMKYRRSIAVWARNRSMERKPNIGVWPGREPMKAKLRQMSDEGATIEQIKSQDALYRAEALRWQDAQEPEYLMRRVMAWWLECPVDYWKLEELEQYARRRTPC